MPTTLLMSYRLFLLLIIFFCCLHLLYVYRELLEPASIDRVLILDRPVQQHLHELDLCTNLDA